MSLLRTLRKLVLGETWLLPAGVAATLLLGGLVVKPVLGSSWGDVGGPLLLASIVVVLASAVARGR